MSLNRAPSPVSNHGGQGLNFPLTVGFRGRFLRLVILRRGAADHDLVNETEVNRNYQKSDLLQIIRILKNYDFFKEPQMELFKSRRKKG